MAFQTALSGLNASQKDLDVVGNNIANSSTTGFKKSRAEFADIYAATKSGAAATQTGAGVGIADIGQQFSQGNVEFTDNNLDLAINGEGFFTLEDTNGARMFTRAGMFELDKEGFMVNNQGHKLLDKNGAALQLTTGSSGAEATDDIDLNINLDADAADLSGTTFDHEDPETYNYSTSTTVHDSLGGAHTATLYFQKTGDNEWEGHMGVEDADGNIQISGPETIEFNSDGSLDAGNTGTNSDGVLEFSDFGAGSGFDPGNGADADMAFNVDLDDAAQGAATQYASDSTVNAIVPDGHTTGTVSGIDVTSDGAVQARYTNGQAEELGIVGLAGFQNPNGLKPVGDTSWVETFESGEPNFGSADTGQFGAIQSGALESSNVDISKELVDMISAQRNYQANAKMITTEDQVTQTVMNIR